jgi:carbamoyl-phosphate synthase large subunit
MASTGEVACFGDDIEEAFLKADLSVGVKIPKKGIFISIGGEPNKYKFLELAINYLFALDLPIYATEKTAHFLHKYGIPVKRVYKLYEGKTPNVIDYFRNGKIDLVINIPDQDVEQDINDGYMIRRAAIDNNLAVFTNQQKAILFLKAIVTKKIETLPIKAWDEYK